MESVALQVLRTHPFAVLVPAVDLDGAAHRVSAKPELAHQPILGNPRVCIREGKPLHAALEQRLGADGSGLAHILKTHVECRRTVGRRQRVGAVGAVIQNHEYLNRAAVKRGMFTGEPHRSEALADLPLFIMGGYHDSYHWRCLSWRSMSSYRHSAEAEGLNNLVPPPDHAHRCRRASPKNSHEWLAFAS